MIMIIIFYTKSQFLILLKWLKNRFQKINIIARENPVLNSLENIYSK